MLPKYSFLWFITVYQVPKTKLSLLLAVHRHVSSPPSTCPFWIIYCVCIEQINVILIALHYCLILFFTGGASVVCEARGVL
jgi:hypothetical protein